MNKLINKVIEWAKTRNIILGSTAIKQHDELLEEVMELRDAIIRNDEIDHRSIFTDYEADCYKDRKQSIEDEIKDAIGDCTVYLINLATMHDMKFEDCLQFAYNEIKDRKGNMIDGKFVKESDLVNE